MMNTIAFEKTGTDIEKLRAVLSDRSLQIKKEMIKPKDLEFLLHCQYKKDENDPYIYFYRVNPQMREDMKAGKRAETNLDILKSVKEKFGGEEGYEDYMKTGMIATLMGDKYVISPEAYSLMAAIVHKDMSGERSLYKDLYLIDLFYKDPQIYYLLYQGEVYIDSKGHQHAYRKVYGIAKSRYMSSLGFFGNVVDYINDELGLPLKKWKVTNTLRKVEFSLPKTENVTPVLCIQDSDVMASSFTMWVEYRIGRSYMIGKEVSYKHTRRIMSKPYKEDIAELIADAVNFKMEVEALQEKKISNLEEAGTVVRGAVQFLLKDPKVKKVFTQKKKEKFINITIDNIPNKFEDMTEKDVILPVIKGLCSMDKNDVDLNYIRKASRNLVKI